MEIPDDIRAAAIAVVNRGYKTGLIEAVALALLAERERATQAERDRINAMWDRGNAATIRAALT